MTALQNDQKTGDKSPEGFACTTSVYQVRAGTGHEVGEVHNTARDFSRT